MLVGVVEVGGAHLPSGSVTSPGSITTGPVSVSGQFVPSTLQVFPGAIVAESVQEVGGAFIDSTAQVFPGRIQLALGTCVKSEVSVRYLVQGDTLGPVVAVCADVRVRYVESGAIDCTSGVAAEVQVRTKVTADDLQVCCTGDQL